MNKKIFEGETNPIFSFISASVPHSEETEVSPPEQQTPVVAPSQETRRTMAKKAANQKTRRLNLLIQPELHEKLTRIACMKQTSVNAVIVAASREYCAKEARALEKYEITFGKDAEEV